MKSFLLTGTLAIFACCSLIGLAQEGTKPATSKATPADKADAKAKGRVPANYGKLGLTEVQRTKIYGVQAQYDDQLDALEKQFATLKAKRDQEVEAVLTDDQRKMLKTLVDAAKEKKPKAPADSPKSESPDPKTEKK